jgi:hypothetical protein
MNLFTSYLVTLETQREQRQYSHWQRLVNQAKRENRLTTLKPEEKKVFWSRTRKRVTSIQ